MSQKYQYIEFKTAVAPPYAMGSDARYARVNFDCAGIERLTLTAMETESWVNLLDYFRIIRLFGRFISSASYFASGVFCVGDEGFSNS